MEIQTIKQEDIEKIKADLEIIKNFLLRNDSEGELSDWAKEELAKARSEHRENYIKIEDLRKDIENEL